MHENGQLSTECSLTGGSRDKSQQLQLLMAELAYKSILYFFLAPVMNRKKKQILLQANLTSALTVA